jgi:membrane dipeptidase
MKEGDMNAMFWAVFVGQGNRDEAGNEAVKQKASQIFDAIHQTVQNNSDKAQIAYDYLDGVKIAKKSKHAIYIGIENGYAIGKDLNLIEEFYKKGARYITLCHSSNNDICDSSTDKNGAEHNGVSEFGKKVIAEMNRLGILIDVSHISDKSFFDVIEFSNKPVVASHSCARALCDHPRNMTDEMIKKLAENEGVIQMCILSDYVKKSPENKERDQAKQKVREKYNYFKNLTDEQMKEANAAWYAIDEKFPPNLATVSDVVNHIDHIVKLVGINHIGIGTDFDGGGGVADCRDVSQIGNITEELVRRGYSEPDIRKIWGENFLRVMKKNSIKKV